MSVLLLALVCSLAPTQEEVKWMWLSPDPEDGDNTLGMTGTLSEGFAVT